MNYDKKINGYINFALTFCAGWLGAHRFARGDVAFGIVYMLTFGLFGFGLAIDLIIALVDLSKMDENDYLYFNAGHRVNISK